MKQETKPLDKMSDTLSIFGHCTQDVLIKYS